MFGVNDTTFYLDTERMKNLKNVKKVLVKAVMHSTDDKQINVKLRADQMLRLRFTARARLKKPVQP
jgi:hypothetical protein